MEFNSQRVICFRLFFSDFLLHLFGILGIHLILTVEKTSECFRGYFNAVRLVMFEWIAMFMPVSDALLRQWLTIMRCCTCLVSNSRLFLHALPNLTPRSNFDQFKWIRRNYCLSLSFPWSASPCEIWHISGQFKWIKLKFVTACEHCKVLYTSYHPKISIPSHL